MRCCPGRSREGIAVTKGTGDSMGDRKGSPGFFRTTGNVAEGLAFSVDAISGGEIIGTAVVELGSGVACFNALSGGADD